MPSPPAPREAPGVCAPAHPRGKLRALAPALVVAAGDLLPLGEQRVPGRLPLLLCPDLALRHVCLLECRCQFVPELRPTRILLGPAAGGLRAGRSLLLLGQGGTQPPARRGVGTTRVRA